MDNEGRRGSVSVIHIATGGVCDDGGAEGTICVGALEAWMCLMRERERLRRDAIRDGIGRDEGRDGVDEAAGSG